MIDEKIKLVHFGNDCAPGIIINDILNIKEKQLFQLGFYNFNDILEYLKESKCEEIYDKSHLFFNNIKIIEFYSYLKEYSYLPDEDTLVNKKYNFKFNHDYAVQDYKIINYEFIVDSFNNKYNEWYLKPLKDRFILYMEIYNKFYKAAKEYINLPVFENTFYYKTLYNL